MSDVQKRPYNTVFPIARRIVTTLAPHCERIELAGSLRRDRDMIGDIEIVALSAPVTNLVGDVIGTELDRFFAQHTVAFTKNGDRYKQFPYGSFVVELWLPTSAAHWGCIFQIRTGSHDFNMWIQRQVAPAAGVMFRGGRLYKRLKSGGREVRGALLETPQETDVFDALGLPFIPPEHRDDGLWLQHVGDNAVTRETT